MKEMLFTSLHFPFFFIFFVGLYFLVVPRFRNAVLFVASCYFYMFLIPSYIFILFGLILIDYGAALAVESYPSRKDHFLWLSVSANIGLLFLFKYFNFFNGNFSWLANRLHLPYALSNLSLVLPLGLSFHTFQSLSYVVEVYWGRYPAEKRLDRYALYVLFWPQLVAGPIERPQNLLRQFQNDIRFQPQNAVQGLRWMMLGFFKKAVIADGVAVYVDRIYNSPHQYQGWALLMATYLFSIQIYCDFSGYTDIARGCAKMMGFDLMKNFDCPYLSQSIGEFWRRWHISLSTWFRDYLFVPVLGNHFSTLPICLTMFFVFTVSGLWHGAKWTFVIWGALHGTYLVVEYLTQERRRKIISALRLNHFPRLLMWGRRLITYHLVVFSWIFFRATGLHDAKYITTRIFMELVRGAPLGWQFLHQHLLRPAHSELIPALVVLAGIAILFAPEVGRRVWAACSLGPAWKRWAFYYAGCLAILLLGCFENRQFIYFQF